MAVATPIIVFRDGHSRKRRIAARAIHSGLVDTSAADEATEVNSNE
jgi:hypothetical protein